tara:strand:+ start:2440 stop:3150 length:711 start_codon:yes stop_codon:yes gene_type:complete
MANSFNSDLVSALAAIQNPPLDGKAAYGEYSTIRACLEAAKPVLSTYNLAVTQLVHTNPDRLVTRITHISGEFIEDGGIPLYCDNQTNPQKLMAAITYAKRNGMCAILGIAGEKDDDGQSATPPDQLPKAKRPKPASPLKPAQPVVVDDIKSTLEITPEQVANRYEAAQAPIEEKWANTAIAGFAKHKHMGEHNRWSSENKSSLDTIKTTYPEIYQRLLTAWKARKSELEGKADVI